MAIGTRYHRIVQVQLAHNEVDFYLLSEFGIHHEENERNHIHLSAFYQFLTRFISQFYPSLNFQYTREPKIWFK